MSRCLVGIATLVIILLAGCATPSATHPGEPAPYTLILNLHKDVSIPDRPVVVFFCDGLSKQIFDAMLAAGELPNIKRFLVERGVSVDRAVVPQPTVTYPNTAAYLTGLYPGHTGVTGNVWFDPRSLIFRDYKYPETLEMVDDDIKAPTLFEMLDHESSTVVLCQTNRGATHFYENYFIGGCEFALQMFHDLNISVSARLKNTAAAANQDRRWPDLVWLYYPATDLVGHAYGLNSPRYHQAIIDFDLEVGNVCLALDREGFLDRTLLVLITDHGFVNTPRHADITAMLKANGLKVYDKRPDDNSEYYQQRYAKFNPYDVVAVVDADRFAKLCFHVPGRPWTHRPDINEIRTLFDDRARAHSGILTFVPRDPIAELLHVDGVQFIVHSDRGAPETRVEVFAADGRAVITRHIDAEGHKSYAYQVTEGCDPFSYGQRQASATLCGGSFHSADEWLAATIDGKYPDLPVQFTELFDSERAGDLCLFAKPGWDFLNTNLGGHGGITSDETVVPFIFAGAGLPGGATIPYARTVALAPTVFQFIRGQRDPVLFSRFDADSLLDILRAARQNSPSNATPAIK